jgi:hypothetical protein
LKHEQRQKLFRKLYFVQKIYFEIVLTNTLSYFVSSRQKRSSHNDRFKLGKGCYIKFHLIESCVFHALKTFCNFGHLIEIERFLFSTSESVKVKMTFYELTRPAFYGTILNFQSTEKNTFDLLIRSSKIRSLDPPSSDCLSSNT